MNERAKQENQGRSMDAEWETLDAAEQAYRDRLGDALEIVLGGGADSLAAMVDGLNAQNVHGPLGQRWTENLLGAELERLGR